MQTNSMVTVVTSAIEYATDVECLTANKTKAKV